ncbi:hypothetical protein Pmani_005411 [Petrolisthes manimaculis]|uniref:Chitin-binding type-2 domain-containing protein n=1 Tax=Petrolisthes manimaculis TaxID=1843537 RepID=A0AAE1QF26_9EUCA|nr:hypothetical protein Pmani_005411 [Petrolisthes manimaculis]
MEGKKRLLQAFCLVIVCSVGVMSQGCQPDCNGMSAGDQVADPQNCTQFYICLGDGLPTDTPIPCEEGNEFPTGATECVGIGPTPCVALCDKSHCRYACNTSLSTDIISSHSNCSVYFLCLPEGTLQRECGLDTPVFNGKDCVKDPYKCCDTPCTAYCSPGLVQIIDPQDCHKYYICVNEGSVEEQYHYECPPDQHFDLQSSHCVSGEACTNLCDGGSIATPGPGSTSGPVTTTPGQGTTTPGQGTTTPGQGTTTTTTTTTTPTTTPDCNYNQYTCTTSGYFSVCQTTCQPYYYSCSGGGSLGVLQQCSGDLVFNPNPNYPYCILPSNCPYFPPK